MFNMIQGSSRPEYGVFITIIGGMILFLGGLIRLFKE
jgi:hypothetical protein